MVVFLPFSLVQSLLLTLDYWLVVEAAAVLRHHIMHQLHKLLLAAPVVELTD